jgi:hypothetical protein
MKYLKDLNFEQLKLNELEDYAELKGVDIEKELMDLLREGANNLYKKLVPKERQVLIDMKLKKEKEKQERKMKPPISPISPEPSKPSPVPNQFIR